MNKLSTPPPTPLPLRLLPDIQLRVKDGLCEVDPDDILSDLVSNDGQVSRWLDGKKNERVP